MWTEQSRHGYEYTNGVRARTTYKHEKHTCINEVKLADGYVIPLDGFVQFLA